MSQVPTSLPGGPGPAISANPAPAIASYAYEEYGSQLPPSTQPYPASLPPSFDGGQPLVQPTPTVHDPPAAAAPTLQNPTQTRRTLKAAQRSARTYDPLRGQGARRQSGGGRGRTRGASNYKLREIEVLLDLVDEELPIASMGWRVVGSRFQDWASVSSHPARTDRSLELKFKQVGFSSTNEMSWLLTMFPLADQNTEANWRWCLPTLHPPHA